MENEEITTVEEAKILVDKQKGTINSLRNIIKSLREEKSADITEKTIAALHLNRENKYIIFFSKSSGIHAADIAELNDPIFGNVTFLVETIQGVRFYESIATKL